MCSGSIREARLRSSYTRDRAQDHGALHRLRLDWHERWSPPGVQIALMSACPGLSKLWVRMQPPWYIHGPNTCTVAAMESLASARYALVTAPEIMVPSTAFGSIGMSGGRHQACKSRSWARVQA